MLGVIVGFVNVGIDLHLHLYNGRKRHGATGRRGEVPAGLGFGLALERRRLRRCWGRLASPSVPRGLRDIRWGEREEVPAGLGRRRLPRRCSRAPAPSVPQGVRNIRWKGERGDVPAGLGHLLSLEASRGSAWEWETSDNRGGHRSTAVPLLLMPQDRRARRGQNCSWWHPDPS